VSESWSYYSSNTIQIPGDLSSKYFPNSLIYIIQGGSAKFFLITAVNVVSGNTRLTVSGGGLYALTADAITAHYYNAEGAAPLLPLRFRPQAEVYSSEEKATLADADIFSILDSTANYGPKKISFAGLKTNSKAYFDTIYSPIGHAHSSLYSVLGHTHSIFSGYDIIVYQSGGLTIAENGWTHAVIDSGTTGPTTNTRVLNAAIAACPANGSLYIGAGTYYLLASTSCTAGPAGYLTYNVAIPITKNMHISGAGINATILMLADGQHYTDHPALIMYAYHPYSDGGFGVAYTAFSLKRMTFDGNVSGQTISYYDGSGLFLAGSMRYNGRFEDLEFRNSACHGFYSGNHGAGWEVDGTFQNIYSHDNAYYDQLDNPERCTLSGWDSYNCGYHATEIGLAIDTWTSGRRSLMASNISIRKGTLHIFGASGADPNADAAINISNLYVDAREVSHNPLWIKDIGNIFIRGGFLRANPSTNYAVWLQHAVVSLSDIEMSGLRGIVSVSGTENSLECHNCDIITESHCMLPVSGDVYNFYVCRLSTNGDSAYIIAAALGRVVGVYGCVGGPNCKGLVEITGTLTHNGTHNLGLEVMGSAEVADGGTISHGLKITPRVVMVQASIEGTMATPSDLGASTFVVNFSGVTTTQTVYWHAKY
jgi:hypothetical protein